MYVLHSLWHAFTMFYFPLFQVNLKKNFFTSAQDEVLMLPAYFFHVWLNHCHFTSFKLMALFQFLLTLRFCTLMIHDLTQESKVAPSKEETERGRISNTQNNKRKHDNGTKCYMCWELWKKPCVLRLLRQQVPSECGVWVDKADEGSRSSVHPHRKRGGFGIAFPSGKALLPSYKVNDIWTDKQEAMAIVHKLTASLRERRTTASCPYTSPEWY